MRAAIFVAQDQPLVIEDVQAVAPGPTDVVVEVGASGVCHTDVAIVHGDLPLPPPMILGHEGAGRVVEVGSAVTRVKVGDRVISSGMPACGTCWYCVRDRSNLCEAIEHNMTVRAVRHGGDELRTFSGLGTFADVMTVSEISVVPVQTDLPDEQIALVGCAIATGVGAALNAARVEPGSSVAVIGCGGVGQAVIQGARICGAARILAIDPVELKRKTAEREGATDLVDPSAGDLVQQVMALTGGRGVDYAFEVVGRPETVAQAYASARRGGSVIVVGMPPADSVFTLPGFSVFLDEKRFLSAVMGSIQIRRDFPRLVALAETGQLRLEPMISRRIALDEVNDAMRAMEAGEVIRSVIL